MKKQTTNHWTESERKVLASNYYTKGASATLELLPGRTYNSMVKQVSYLKKRGYRFKI
jgi:hypothetical protein